MSEPVKSVEIEDVLSSIRRLVSEDHRQPAPHPAEEPKPAPDRLVLTDALRVPVADSDDTSTAEEEPLVLTSAEPAEEPEAEPAADEGRAQSDDAATEDDAPHHEAHQDDAAHVEHSDEHEHDGDQQDGHAEHHDHDAQHHTGDDHHVAPVEEHHDHGQDEHHDPAQHDDHAADTSEEDQPPQAEPAAEDVPWADPTATLYEAAGLAETPEEGDADIRPLGEKIAALEEVIGRTDDQWEPDGTSGDEYSGTDVETLEWEDTDPELDEEAHAPDPAPVVEEDPVISEAVADDDDLTMDAMIDEAALRDLVADIVREELQGALGERITRNVRKLVRREIHRALAVKDLE